MKMWKFAILTLLCGLLWSPATQAQDVKGIVYELESSQRLQEVTVKNIRTEETVRTDAEGNFQIAAALNDLLSFTQPGYEVDTAFIYQEGIQRIYLVRDSKSIVIDEIVISRLTDSRLAAEIARAKSEGKVTEVSQNRGGFRLSPSRLFGRESKLARKNLDLLLQEQNNRKVDRLFNAQTIRATIPLDDSEMSRFRELYRPTLEFIETASPEDIQAYILDAYSTFKSNAD